MISLGLVWFGLVWFGVVREGQAGFNSATSFVADKIQLSQKGY